MDCCNTNEKSEYSKNIEEVKGGKSIKMERRIWMWIIIGALFIAVLFLTFKLSVGGANVVQNAGTVAKTITSSASSSYGGMVGGC